MKILRELSSENYGYLNRWPTVLKGFIFPIEVQNSRWTILNLRLLCGADPVDMTLGDPGKAMTNLLFE